MTSIDKNNHSKIHNPSVYTFLEGDIAKDYTNPEEKGFHITGNIGSLLNLPSKDLDSIHEGIVFNAFNHTDDSENIIGNVKPLKNDWAMQKIPQPKTPQLHCNEKQLSELLPHYPNGIPNINLNPNCDLKLGNYASPTLAGISTFGYNDPELINDARNNIGHELETYGIANKTGTRVIGQGRSSCDNLLPGYNVPSLKTVENNNSYYSTPVSFSPHVPLYQVGNWTENTDNFLKTFNENVSC